LFIFIYLTYDFINENNKNIKKIKKTKLFLPGYIISGLAWSIIINYLPLLLDERTDLSLSLIGLMISVWVGIGVIVCMFYGKITNKLGRKNVIILSYVTIGLMSVSLSIFTDALILLIVIVFLGIATFLSYPALFSFVSEIIDENIEGRMFGYIFTVQLAGGTIILFLSGVASDLFGI
jgi:FSR family fosmidomycin resistance protein-like MFS transporter